MGTLEQVMGCRVEGQLATRHEHAERPLGQGFEDCADGGCGHDVGPLHVLEQQRQRSGAAERVDQFDNATNEIVAFLGASGVARAQDKAPQSGTMRVERVDPQIEGIHQYTKGTVHLELERAPAQDSYACWRGVGHRLVEQPRLAAPGLAENQHPRRLSLAEHVERAAKAFELAFPTLECVRPRACTPLPQRGRPDSARTNAALHHYPLHRHFPLTSCPEPPP